MKRIAILLLIVLCWFTTSAQNFQQYYILAKEAYSKKDFESYYSNLKEANKLHPYHQVILYRLGIAAALTGHQDESIANLHKAILIDATFPLKDIPDLNEIQDKREFQELLSLQSELMKPVIRSDTAFIIKDRTLHTEGIEYNPLRKEFYLGSIHKRKIIIVNQRGEITDFCPSSGNGMTSIFGLKVDTKKNLLWACSSPLHEMENYDSTLRSAVFKFDLRTRKLIAKFQIESEKQDGMFGDLIISKAGEVFIPDSKNNIIYKVNEKENKLEVFYTSVEFWNVQGFTFSNDEKFLFISDYIKGIFRLDLKTKELIQVVNNADLSLKGIDGLYFYNNSLIATQNGVVPLRVSRYFLNKSLSAIESVEILDRAHPAFNEPTLGVINDSLFYYIANSQWGGYENGKQKPESQLQDIVILKAKLK